MLRKDFEIEVCAGNIESVIAADKGGANRIELCDNISEGGTTPSMGTIFFAKKNTRLEVNVLIRPRGGDFVYSRNELELILKDIEMAVVLGADGIVCGCLEPDGSINEKWCRRIIEASDNLPVTFHRAFDLTPDPLSALEVIKELGFSRILTSGQCDNAMEGKELIRKLCLRSGNIQIIPGGGVNEFNIRELAVFTNANAFHASLSTPKEPDYTFKKSKINFNSTSNIPGDMYMATDIRRVKSVVKILEEL